jgi:hypothetical protein
LSWGTIADRLKSWLPGRIEEMPVEEIVVLGPRGSGPPEEERRATAIAKVLSELERAHGSRSIIDPERTRRHAAGHAALARVAALDPEHADFFAAVYSPRSTISISSTAPSAIPIALAGREQLIAFLRRSSAHLTEEELHGASDVLFHRLRQGFAAGRASLHIPQELLPHLSDDGLALLEAASAAREQRGLRLLPRQTREELVEASGGSEATWIEIKGERVVHPATYYSSRASLYDLASVERTDGAFATEVTQRGSVTHQSVVQGPPATSQGRSVGAAFSPDESRRLVHEELARRARGGGTRVT